MKKTVLASAVIAAITLPLYANPVEQPLPPPLSTEKPPIQSTEQKPTQPEETPAPSTSQPSTAKVPTAETSAPAPVTMQPTPAQGLPNPNLTPQPTLTVDCHYHISAQTTQIDSDLLMTWSKKAVTQSFEFNPLQIDENLEELKNCYTDKGWESFNDALKKSGNVNAIKSQQLNVNSQVDGEVTLTNIKDNQWRLKVPLQVIYQNTHEKVTQQLNIDILVGRKINGDLGIMQMIASPRNKTLSTSQNSHPEQAPAQ